MLRRLGSVYLLVFFVGALAFPAGAQSPSCQAAAIGALATTADGLRVVAPTALELRADDVLLQLNGQVLRRCADLRRALAEVRRHPVAVLLLVRRNGGMEAVALGQSPRPPTGVVAAAAAPPATPTPTVTPVAFSPSDVAAIRDMLDRLLHFGRTLRAALPVLSPQPWTRDVHDLQQLYDARRAQLPALTAVEPILGYYRTVADIVAYKENAERAAGYLRPRPDVVLDYSSDWAVGEWLRRYSFLRASVVRPSVSVGGLERAGRWSPDHAVKLLVEQALADGAALEQQLEPAAP